MWSSGYVLEGNSECSPVGAFWRGTVGVVQWVRSGGEQWVWSSGCVLEGNSGCGPVGVFWRGTVDVVQCVCFRDDH